MRGDRSGFATDIAEKPFREPERAECGGGACSQGHAQQQDQRGRFLAAQGDAAFQSDRQQQEDRQIGLDLIGDDEIAADSAGEQPERERQDYRRGEIDQQQFHVRQLPWVAGPRCT